MKKSKAVHQIRGLVRPCVIVWKGMENRALITGASSGIGRELAKVFAANGFCLVLVARNESRLNQLAEELRATNKLEVMVLPQDLSKPGAASAIFSRLAGSPISVLVNNAGFGSYGPFAKSSLDVQTEMIQVNVMALVQLTHLFLQPMLAQRSGRVLNVASTAAFQPGPMMSGYYASKAFVYSFSYALANELNALLYYKLQLCFYFLTAIFYRYSARSYAMLGGHSFLVSLAFWWRFSMVASSEARNKEFYYAGFLFCVVKIRWVTESW